MKKDTYILLFAIAFAWFMIWFFGNDTDITKQLKESENKRELLTKELRELNKEKDSIILLNNALEKRNKILLSLNNKKDEAIKDNANNVYTLNERELDSSIRNARYNAYKSTITN